MCLRVCVNSCRFVSMSVCVRKCVFFLCVNRVMQLGELEAFEQRGDHVSLKLKGSIRFFFPPSSFAQNGKIEVQFEVFVVTFRPLIILAPSAKQSPV